MDKIDHLFLGWWLAERQVKAGGLNGRLRPVGGRRTGVAWFAGAVFAGLIGFLGIMRPGEFTNLRMSDFVLPSVIGSEVQAVFVKIGRPKMRHLGARREHVRIDDPVIVELLEAIAALRGNVLLLGRLPIDNGQGN